MHSFIFYSLGLKPRQVRFIKPRNFINFFQNAVFSDFWNSVKFIFKDSAKFFKGLGNFLKTPQNSLKARRMFLKAPQSFLKTRGSFLSTPQNLLKTREIFLYPLELIRSLS